MTKPATQPHAFPPKKLFEEVVNKVIEQTIDLTVEKEGEAKAGSSTIENAEVDVIQKIMEKVELSPNLLSADAAISTPVEGRNKVNDEGSESSTTTVHAAENGGVGSSSGAPAAEKIITPHNPSGSQSVDNATESALMSIPNNLHGDWLVVSKRKKNQKPKGKEKAKIGDRKDQKEPPVVTATSKVGHVESVEKVRNDKTPMIMIGKTRVFDLGGGAKSTMDLHQVAPNRFRFQHDGDDFMLPDSEKENDVDVHHGVKAANDPSQVDKGPLNQDILTDSS
ncbi:hypothetical protein SESBI_43653 [Sesbania bispinosa]|nr:hypothetical protein SESBI_43653 [Sesbania bispinosa]